MLSIFLMVFKRTSIYNDTFQFLPVTSFINLFGLFLQNFRIVVLIFGLNSIFHLIDFCFVKSN
jgi:hypothetical protein